MLQINSQSDFKKLVNTLYIKYNKNMGLVGLVLRDEYLLDSRYSFGKKLMSFIDYTSNEYRIPSQIVCLLPRIIALRKYLTNNPRDKHNKRTYNLQINKFYRLVQYSLRKGLLVLPMKLIDKNLEIVYNRYIL